MFVHTYRCDSRALFLNSSHFPIAPILQGIIKTFQGVYSKANAQCLIFKEADV